MEKIENGEIEQMHEKEGERDKFMHDTAQKISIYRTEFPKPSGALSFHFGRQSTAKYICEMNIYTNSSSTNEF